jgi:hypothetical protein
MTIRASRYLAAITGILGLLAMSSAHAGTGIGAALKTAAPTKSIVTKVGIFGYSDCGRRRYHERRRCRYRRWRHRRYRHRHHTAGIFGYSDCGRRSYHERCRHRRWHHRRRAYRPRREVHYHYHYYYPLPVPEPNYEIYTYRRPYEIGPNTDIQAVYGWYDGYYYAYPYYPGIDD